MQPSPFARSNSPQAGRGTSTADRSRARGRGRGRGRGASQPVSSDTPASLSQTHTRGSRATFSGASRGGRNRGVRGRGSSGNVSRTFNTPSPGPTSSRAEASPPPVNPRPQDIRHTNHDVIAARRTKLQAQYEQYKQRAIQQKLMSDPDKPEKLESAIFTKGTCTHMCDEKERVDRIFEQQLDRAETLPNPENGQPVPIEGRMVKRFRRAAAGVGKQIPEELRTPRTLQKTLDYLINNIIGPSQRLAQHHKFVWDRTRAIRNDCSIQSFTQPEDVKLEVDCYERIARFHILSAHLLSKPDALQNGEDFVPKQEVEQLTKTFQTLMDKYDGFGQTMHFPHEAEFRAYFILFAPMTTIADLDDQVQRWPRRILNDGRVQTALQLRAAAESTDQPVGSRQFNPVPCFIAQKNAGLYWDILRSQRVSYLMACVAEMSFRNIRFAALDSLWHAAKNASEKGQATMRSWTKPLVRDYLSFDDNEQVEEFCSKFGLAFAQNASNAQEYLDFKSLGASSLDYSSLGQDHTFSESIVEQKRRGRTLVAVLNGMTVAEAAKEGMVTQDPALTSSRTPNKSSLFVSQDAEDDVDEAGEDEPNQNGFEQPARLLNPQANSFTPSSLTTLSTEVAKVQQPRQMTQFGQSAPPASVLPGEPPRSIFGMLKHGDEPVGAPATSILRPTFAGLGTTQSQGSRTTAGNPDTASSPGFNAPTTSSPTIPLNLPNVIPAPVLPQAQNPTSIFQFAQPVKTSPSATEKQTDNITASQPTFTWSEPVQSGAPASAPSLSIFSAPKPSVDSSGISVFSSHSASVGPSTSAYSSFVNAPVTVTPRVSSPPNSIEPAQQTQSVLSNIDQVSQTPSSSKPEFPARVDDYTLSTEPPSKSQGLTEPLSPEGSKFPPVFNAVSKFPGSTAAEPPIQSFKPADSGLHHSTPYSKTNSQTPSSPQATASEQADAKRRKSVDKDQIVEHLCRIGLTQKDGILDMFVAAKVSNLCQDVFRSFQISRFERKISNLKKVHLRRKFFALWKSRIHQKRLQKRADKRKRMFAASVKAQSERERKRQEEVAVLAEIMESEKHKRRIQEEERKRQEEKARRQQADPQPELFPTPSVANAKGAQRPQNTNIVQTAGQKRKLLANNASRSNIQDIAMSPTHKRSRTLGASLNDPRAPNAVSSRVIPIPQGSTSSGLRRSLSHRTLRQSIAHQGIDQTESDYFRLKALGIDPNTPLIPDTAASLAAKQRKETEHREAVLSKVRHRPVPVSHRSTSKQEPKPAVPSQTAQAATTTYAMSQVSSSVTNETDDPFLRQLREARQAMTADADWLKSQTVEVEKEIKQQEEFRRSAGSNNSVDHSLPQSANGLARSVTGYDYVPPNLKPGQTLSRTEQRIRATGARGLANLQTGERPSSRPQYAPVAMSRRSASLLHAEDAGNQASGVVSGRKRSVDEVNPRNGVPAYHNVQSDIQTSKKPRNDILQPSPTKIMTMRDLDALQAPHSEIIHNGYSTQSVDEATEDDETGDELMYVGQNQNDSSRYIYEDEDEEEEEEYSDELDDEAEEEDDDDAEAEEDEEAHQGAYTGNPRDSFDQAEPYDEDDEEEVPGYTQQFVSSARGSRAVSASVATPDTGLGSTVEDAIELSD